MNPARHAHRWLRTAVLVLLGCVAVNAQEPGKPVKIPDFTAGDKPDATHDWTLGATGARGWIYTANGHSAAARQILITAVAARSPADGVLQVGDVILGVDGAPFTDDARKCFAQALTGAEATDGKLALLRWRTGTSGPASLTLPVLGSYSATAPYDCTKSQRILTLGCQALARRMAEPDYAKRLNPIPRALNALALLAGGDPDHLAAVRAEARWAADFSLPPDDYQSWPYGYVLMFLSEYALATGDQSVMPGLTRLALATANGQSAVGTWGHRFALPNGNLNGYGCMNQPGISLCIGMALAREAGVHDPVLDRAIAKAAGFVRWFVNKGAVPYGDHQPFPAHEDNGKCASAAVLYDLLGDREATEFFARMSAAAYDERERGHTGNYFNLLWALLGVARGGPALSGAYLHETAWYYDLARGWDGKFIYQGSPVGEEESGSYANWDCSGSYLLAYAMPLKKLLLTGRKPACVPPLSATAVRDVIDAGRDFAFRNRSDPYDRRTTAQLMAGLSNWSPFVRSRSAVALAKRTDAPVPDVIALLTDANRDARYGGCVALGELGPRADAAGGRLRALLKDPDPWLQCLACLALPNLGIDERTASVSDLLALIVRGNAADPRRMTQRAAAIALFAPYPGSRTPKSIIAHSLTGVDRALLYPAVNSLLQNEDSVARNAVHMIYDDLTQADLAIMLPAIVTAVEHMAPSNEMFGDGIRLAGLDLLSRLHLREGMDLCLAVIETERWGAGERIKRCLDYLQRYGAHAKSALPRLAEMRTKLAAGNGAKTHADQIAQFDRCIAAISSATALPELVSVTEFKPAAPSP